MVFLPPFLLPEGEKEGGRDGGRESHYVILSLSSAMYEAFMQFL